MIEQLTFEQLKMSVEGPAAAFRCRIRLQPDAGDGGKVFPPTYAGGVYAVEDRRFNGEVVRCVLLDSVQSQANRMEEALQDAFLPNWRELKTDADDPPCALPVIAVHVENHGWVTSLTAPHRIHDAILRDSNRNGTRFRDSDIGQAIVAARIHAATGFYKYCPTVLLFGTWDSTAGEGLDSAKIPRAVVSEIIGVNVTAGVRTGGRLDPLGIERMNVTFYRKGKSGWTLNESEADKKYKKGKGWTEDVALADKGKEGKPTEEKSIVWGNKPSDINHGNIPPDMARFKADEVRRQNLGRLPDLLESNPVTLRYDVESGNGRLQSHVAFEGETVRIRDGAVKPGGVTVEYALHTWTLSLTQLRRLRFPAQAPKGESEASPEAQPDRRNHAARTVLAALSLYALALQNECGYWLRSRCELIPEGELKLELLGSSSAEFSLGSAKNVREKLLEPAIEEAENLGLTWEKKVVRLTPTEELKKLVELSDSPRSEVEDADTEEVTADDSTQG
jgi:CRISPR-associated protein Csb1